MRSYGAFIACSHADRRWGARLRRALRRYRPPAGLVGNAAPARLRPVFLDEEEFPTSRDLPAPLRRALEASDRLIVICSPHAARSIWIDEEIRAFRAARPGAPILALLVDGEAGGSL
ncbi:MAG: toll/interleukin-1 receptor domain-containing protein, partial [Pikeienuella sp.]